MANRARGKFELKKAKNGLFFFNLLAGNGQVLLLSQFYESKASATKGIESIMKNAALKERYDRLISMSGKPYFVIKAGNHQVIAQSQMYELESSRDNGIKSVMKNVPNAEFIDWT